MKEWFSAKELAGLKGVSTHATNVTRQAKKQNWEMRALKGVKGGGLEYHISSLPPETQQALRLQAALAVVPIAEMTVQQPNLELSRKFNEASDKAREKAKAKAEACLQLKAFLDQGFPMMSALEGAAKAKNVSAGSLKNWYYKVQPYPVHEWQAVLITESGKAKKPSRKAFIEQEAWDCFLADYLRPEKPDLRACYRRTEQLAKHYGWEIASLQTFQRRVVEEIPYEVILLKREGANAVAKLVPSLQRTVKDLLAGEWINGDGYQHNVFVKWHNGEIVRPKTWFWQDVRTRRILGYRTAVSENTDSIRHALMDVIYQYGIPKTVTLDNTWAAANKAMTGGIENRYRFKHNELDPKGILPILGIEVHFTSVLYGEGHGQAKPIERAFGRGGIGEKVDKRPELEGFYTGKNVLEKPDNYNGGKDGVDYEIFLQALAAGVAEYNAQLDRKTGRQALNTHIDLVAKSDVVHYADELNQQLDGTALTFADSGMWNSYLAVSQYRLALISDLRTRGDTLKKSRQITLRETAPALAVMYAQTGNAAGWLQFCKRNNVRHPLLVIGGQNMEVIDG